MKTILVGGFETTHLERIRRAFAPLAEDYNLRPISSIAELVQLLEPLQGDLLILNLAESPSAMLDWIAAVAKVRASIPVVSIGGDPKAIYQEYNQRFPDCYFPQMDALPAPFTDEELLGVIRVAICDTAWGIIGGLSLSTLLQMIHMERKTCTIRVISGRRQGFFYLRAGDVINARYRRREGLEAAYLLLASTSPRAEISGLLHDGTQHINLSLEELLMNAAQIQDEQTDPAFDEASTDGIEHLPASEQGKWKTTENRPAPPKPRKRHGLLFTVASLLIVGSLGAAVLSRKKEIEVSTRPVKASISLDGRPCGDSPLTLSLRKVEGMLRVEAPGYLPAVHQLSSDERRLDIVLEPMPKAPADKTGTQEDTQTEPAHANLHANHAHKEKPKAEKKAKGDIFDQVRNQ